MTRRILPVLGLTLVLGAAGSGVALAQEPIPAPSPAPPPVTNCDPFSCLFVIPVGPFGPFIFFPNGLAPGTPPVGPPVPIIP